MCLFLWRGSAGSRAVHRPEGARHFLSAWPRRCAMEVVHMRVTQVGLWTTLMVTMLAASSPPQDPGVRPGAAAGGMLPELSAEQQEFFAQGQQAFEEPE